MKNKLIFEHIIKNCLNENTSITGDISKFFLPLIEDYVKFLKNELAINDELIAIKFKKINKKEIGFINFLKVLKGDNEIIIVANTGYPLTLDYIAHEITHIKQVVKKELQVKNGYFFWKNEKDISIKEYNDVVKQVDLNRYNGLKWEIEANFNQSNLTKKYLQSSNFKELYEKTVEPNLVFTLQILK